MRMIAGFRWYNVSWTAAGGSYIYSSGGGFRNDVGSFAAGTTVINYEQWMKTPFLGLGGTMDFGRWSIDGSVIGSLWGQGSDRDDRITGLSLGDLRPGRNCKCLGLPCMLRL